VGERAPFLLVSQAGIIKSQPERGAYSNLLGDRGFVESPSSSLQVCPWPLRLGQRVRNKNFSFFHESSGCGSSIVDY
jgi:hypothetical protein